MSHLTSAFSLTTHLLHHHLSSLHAHHSSYLPYALQCQIATFCALEWLIGEEASQNGKMYFYDNVTDADDNKFSSWNKRFEQHFISIRSISDLHLNSHRSQEPHYYFHKYCSAYFLHCVKAHLQRRYWEGLPIRDHLESTQWTQRSAQTLAEASAGLTHFQDVHRIPFEAYALRYRYLGETKDHWSDRIFRNLSNDTKVSHLTPTFMQFVESMREHINSLGVDFTLLQCIAEEKESAPQSWHFPNVKCVKLYSMHDSEKEMDTLIGLIRDNPQIDTIQIFQQRWNVESWAAFLMPLFNIDMIEFGAEKHNSDSWWSSGRQLYQEEMQDDPNDCLYNSPQGHTSFVSDDIYGDVDFGRMEVDEDGSDGESIEISSWLKHASSTHQQNTVEHEGADFTVPKKRRRIVSPSPPSTPAFQKGFKLRKIELCGFNLNSITCSMWCAVITHQKQSLQVFNCALNQLDEPDTMHLIQAVLQANGLQEFYFSENYLNMHHLEVLSAGILLGNWSSLKALDLSHTSIQNNSTAQLVDALTASSTELETLRLTGNPLSDIHASLSRFLTQVRTIRELNVSDTELSPIAILQYATNSSSLQILNLNKVFSWTITDDLHKHLRGLHITHLYLAHTGVSLTNEIVESLLAILEQLQVLDLSGNKLGDASFVHIEQLLHRWTDINVEMQQPSLSLLGNQLTDSFAVMLFQFVQIHKSHQPIFHVLDLSSNFFSYNVGLKLRSVETFLCENLLIASQHSPHTFTPSEHTTAT